MGRFVPPEIQLETLVSVHTVEITAFYLFKLNGWSFILHNNVSGARGSAVSAAALPPPPPPPMSR